MRAVNDQRSVAPVDATAEIATVPDTVNGSVSPQLRRMTAATADGAPVAIATLPPATATVPPMQASPEGQALPVGMPPAQVGQSAAARPASTILLYVWIVLFGFVGTQLAWTLRRSSATQDHPSRFSGRSVAHSTPMSSVRSANC